jgi:hypothetical protein
MVMLSRLGNAPAPSRRASAVHLLANQQQQPEHPRRLQNLRRHQSAIIRPDSQGTVHEGSTSASSSQDSYEQQPGSSTAAEEVWDYEAPQHVVDRNKQFIEQQLVGKVILAPLTKGGNLPFRWACPARLDLALSPHYCCDYDSRST